MYDYYYIKNYQHTFISFLEWVKGTRKIRRKNNTKAKSKRVETKRRRRQSFLQVSVWINQDSFRMYEGDGVIK